MTHFSPSLALLCVRASSRAYVAATDSEPSTDTQYLILELPDTACVRTAGRAGSPLPAAGKEYPDGAHGVTRPTVIVAFRGSSSLEDFLCDADFFTTRLNLNTDARVHLGFYKAYKSIESRLKARLDEIVNRRTGARPVPGRSTLATVSSQENPGESQQPDVLRAGTARAPVAEDGRAPSQIPQPTSRIPIIFTGHSLGGALAILAAYYLSHFYNIEAVFTFGAPDVGNCEFVAHYNRIGSEICGNSRNSRKSPLGEKTFCLANAGDPVTWLPPYRFGFRRAGKFFFLPGVTWMAPGFRAPLLARVMAGAIQVFQNWRRGKLALLTNHSIALYKERITRLANV
jgi:hypothetical protein